MQNVLFITYDGITDPLGQSQILPYITGIAKQGYRLTILSFEKPERYQKLKQSIEAHCQKFNIEWHPVMFHSGIPVVSKAYDRYLMKKNALRLFKEKKIDIIHCRSYISSEIGMSLKKKYGAKFIFDMRGFWPDEKKDGGAWNQSNPIFRAVYNFYKKKEKEYIQSADAIVSLTVAAKHEIERWDFYDSKTPVYVVPCSVDTDFFACRNAEDKAASKQKLGFAPEDFVLSYLGALGSWYMLDEMLLFFSLLKKKYSNAKFLIVSHTDKNYINNAIEKHQLAKDDFKITEASRHEVPVFLKASDLNLSFIKPVYSKIASSPTKLGEVLSMGIPVITNSGVGDVKEIVEQIGGGIVINDFSEKTFAQAIEKIPAILQYDEKRISENTNTYLSLEKAIDTYSSLYKNLS